MIKNMNTNEFFSRIAKAIKIVGILGGLLIAYGGISSFQLIHERLGWCVGGAIFGAIFYGIGWIVDGLAQIKK